MKNFLKFKQQSTNISFKINYSSMIGSCRQLLLSKHHQQQRHQPQHQIINDNNNNVDDTQHQSTISLDTPSSSSLPSSLSSAKILVDCSVNQSFSNHSKAIQRSIIDNCQKLAQYIHIWTFSILSSFSLFMKLFANNNRRSSLTTSAPSSSTIMTTITAMHFFTLALLCLFILLGAHFGDALFDLNQSPSSSSYDSNIFGIQLSSCPFECDCQGLTVDCSNRGLVYVPKTLPLEVRRLYLDGNNLTILRQNDFQRLPYLRVLQIMDNQIQTLEPGVFDDLKSLEKFPLFYFNVYYVFKTQ